MSASSVFAVRKYHHNTNMEKRHKCFIEKDIPCAMTRLTGVIIDDEKDVADLVAIFLELKGLDIVGRAYNGCQGVQIFEKENPDFVILDMKMPEYDGAYAISEIKKKNPDAKIFVVTGFCPYDNLEKDVTFVFTKPVDLTKLYEKITASLA
ncbi:MAG: response regulator [Thaumarchaeota archaeon]|nr:response regulator [Nitrososphaerota archaeon]